MTEPAEPSNAIRVGYARISTRAQDHAAQLELLNAADCREIVEETISTRRADRPKLTNTLNSMKPGDTLVITKPDRVARSVKELLVFLEDELAPRGINLHILTGICASIHRPNGQSIADKMLFLVAAMAAEMERDLIQERTLDGLAAAAAHGRKGGRPPAVTDDVLAAARARRERGQSITTIARELGVGRSTLYRALENDEPLAPAAATPAEPTGIPDHKHDQAPAKTPAPAAPQPTRPDTDVVVEPDAEPLRGQPPATAMPAPTTPRRTARSRRESKPADDGQDALPWTSEADPVRRRRWYTDDELDAVQVVKSDRNDGAYWVIIVGELLGTVTPHRGVTGGRSGWEARRRGGSLAWHLGAGVGGAGKRPPTRDKAVIDLIADVQHSWRNHRERAKRDAVLRRLDEGEN